MSDALNRVSSDLKNNLQKGSRPTTLVKADEAVFRIIDPWQDYSIVYSSDGKLKRKPIALNSLTQIYEGTLTSDHRWAGADPLTGQKGSLGSSSWGTSYGAAAENIYYGALRGMKDPNVAFKYLKSGIFRSLLVRESERISFLRGTRFPYVAAPNVDILVGRTKSSILALDFDASSPDFWRWDDSKSRLCSKELKELGYPTLSAILLDPSNRRASRFIAQALGEPASGDLYKQLPVYSTSVRSGDLKAAGIPSRSAMNLTIVGPERADISDKVDLVGLIEVRTEDGIQTASVGSLQDAYGGGSSALLDAFGRPLGGK